MRVDIVEDEGGSLVGVRQELSHPVSKPLEGLVPSVPAQDDQCKEKLQR